MLWRLYFEVYDFLVGLIPVRVWRETIRRKELYDYRKKFNALKHALPRGEFRHVRVIKGGWNIGFIVNNKYVCKIRKYYEKNMPVEKIVREKRITDAFGPIVPIKIPKIDIIDTFWYNKIDEHEICEAIHKFRIAWQESNLHKFFMKRAVTEYTYTPKDFHDYD